MEEVRILDGELEVLLRDVSDPYEARRGFGFVDFAVALRAPGLHAESGVWLLRGDDDLAAFLDGLARDWRGWQGAGDGTRWSAT